MLVVTAVATAFGAASKPNIIIILADDLGACDLGYTGSKFYDTPNIDGLAKQSMRFNQAYAACPVCSPTRAAMMTGKYPPRTGITDYIGGYAKGRLLPAPNANHLALEKSPLPSRLRKPATSPAILASGTLAVWRASCPSNKGLITTSAVATKAIRSCTFSPYNIETLPDGPVGEYLTDRLATECEKFIEANKDHPFFLNFCAYAVHTPLQAKKEMIKKYRRQGREADVRGKGVPQRSRDLGSSRAEPCCLWSDG